jgi:hypothetical protein
VKLLPAHEEKRLAALRAKLCGVPLSEERKKKCSQSLKAKWASGTRKPCSPDVGRKISDTLKRLYREGKITSLMVGRKLSPEEARRMASFVKPENRARALRALAEAKRGTPNPPGPSGAGINNWNAKFWRFRTPAGVLVEGRNLRVLIEENARLFDPEDLIPRTKTRNRAYSGLAGLCQQSPNGPTSWKGWTPVAMFEGPRDPLDRKELA